MGWICHHLRGCTWAVAAPLLTCSVTRSTPPSFPPTFPLGRRVGKLHRRWSSGALGLELLMLQVHLHLSRCSAALPGIFFALCDSVSLSIHSLLDILIQV